MNGRVFPQSTRRVEFHAEHALRIPSLVTFPDGFAVKHLSQIEGNRGILSVLLPTSTDNLSDASILKSRETICFQPGDLVQCQGDEHG